MSLELRLATRVFIEESSLDRLLNEALRLSISDSWFTSLQWGQKKLSLDLLTSSNAILTRPAHLRCSHALHAPSQKIESCPAFFIDESTILSSQIGQITSGVASFFSAVAYFCFLALEAMTAPHSTITPVEVDYTSIGIRNFHLILFLFSEQSAGMSLRSVL